MNYAYLAVAIISETIATSSLKQSLGFTKLIPTIIVILGYIIAFYFLSLALKEIPTGIAYAIWSGVGIVLISTVAWIFQGQKLDMPAMVGMALIIAGVIVMNVFSKTSSH
ncbi:DMT family transporter [Swingsia samuiensis]|uniref:QacE family quaternary ammonium compound efflux SMR transporter n=1 Tax=Swingsia samuiensis TaxID=1293412 RepID=A0A4Y6UL17_9PROT|nr:SMR family transporter [Swingsia samuiensis]QDH17328.1 QacE family quaternary ammonium compound efflux SMR transporter [Swingsia samuiensis]